MLTRVVALATANEHIKASFTASGMKTPPNPASSISRAN